MNTNKLLKKIHDSKHTTPVPGEVWWVENLPFEGNNGCKSRPVVIMGYDGGAVRYRKCTSKDSDSSIRLRICDLGDAGMMKKTFVDLEIHEVSRNRLSRRIGKLSPPDWEYVKSN